MSPPAASCFARRLLLVRPPIRPLQRRLFTVGREPKPSAVPTPSRAAFAAAFAFLSCAAFWASSPSSLRSSFVAETPSAPAGVTRAPPAPKTDRDTRDPSLPRFRLADVHKHGPESDRPWVVHADKVYDITDWIPAHPGGQVILRAAGGSIDPYWNIFTIHKEQYVYDILAQYLIGYVDQADLVDGRPAQEQIEDPFAQDPARHPELIVRTAKPCNAETPSEALAASFLTPNELFYVRNHMWVPKVHQAASHAYILTVELPDGTLKRYTLDDLKTKFPSRKVTAVLQCSGNRRRHMTQGSGRSTNGLQWAAGAISNASWEGVMLADVLADAGFDTTEALAGASSTKHVHLLGKEAYGASIPVKKATDPQGDVLLAYAMNEAALPPDHGFPLRAIVPGHVAARSVKWLSHIALSEDESTSQWQRRDYKCFGPNQTKVDWDTAPAIQELPVQSAITAVKTGGWVDTGRDEGSRGPAQRVSLAGYAFSGGGRSIIRVDVSLDNGRSWTQARLLPDCVGPRSQCHGHGAWSWSRWRLDGTIPLAAFTEREQRREYPSDVKPEKPAVEPAAAELEARRCTTVLVKATDDAYNSQPESHGATWNLRGNLATAWHRIQVCAECSPDAGPRSAASPASSTSPSPCPSSFTDGP
ncbi:hypothetical protein L249_5539 [Ophiocordyceps polyrhachis-furcata BCC 54312]|uniref:Nitrate reductase [NADPH] n=1 Tax=Ophiocordyceps polyrhachis-furcata BCC 54312 TaxID=1330021 RepID=A0A367LGJ3_9HYPO|nr:hypothetical protein L249_5539 [Ophiocordyceps polyrhachis-furcata BCC 54312]